MEKENEEDKDQGVEDGNVQQFSSQQELVPNQHDEGGGGESDYSDMDGSHQGDTADGDEDERTRRISAMGRIVGTLQVSLDTPPPPPQSLFDLI